MIEGKVLDRILAQKDYNFKSEKNSSFLGLKGSSIAFILTEAFKTTSKNALVIVPDKEKAAYIYDVIDNSDFYEGTVVKEDRSLMNIPFRLPTEDLEKKFVAEAAAKNMFNLKGHRSVGGCRASVYNSLPMDSAKALSQFMLDFEKANK